MRDARRSDLLWLFALAGGRLVLHFALNHQYGWHRDELGLRDDALDLDWGYVNYPPLTPLLARIALELFGDSLTGFRTFAVLAQCAAMVLTGLIARELGGRRGAQLAAAAAMAAAPFALLAGSMMQYVAFDFLWWVLAAWLLVRLANGADPRLWLALGVVIGFGMLTRFTMLICVAGIVAATLATPLRRQLAMPWPWFGALVSMLLFTPHVVWQWQHGFVTLEFLEHIRLRDAAIGRADGFVAQQFFVNTNPLLVPLWLTGLAWLSVAQAARPFRALAWVYAVPALLFGLLGARAYYLAPAYPMLLAAGSVAVQRFGEVRSWARTRPARAGAAGWLALAFAISAMLALPLAPVNSSVWRMSRGAHDNFAEQIGWPELAAQVAAIHAALPEDQREQAGILVHNYGQAGALNLYGPALGLPRPISGVNTHWYRGYGDPPPRVLIVLGADPRAMTEVSADCREVARIVNAEGVPNEETLHRPAVFVCSNQRFRWDEIWPQMQSFG